MSRFGSARADWPPHARMAQANRRPAQRESRPAQGEGAWHPAQAEPRAAQAARRSAESDRAAAPGAGAPSHPATAAVSVVIVTWNSGSDLLRCLGSLQRHPPSGAWEAIVVDNGSTDGSLEEARVRFPWLRVIANERNLGLAAANNQGIAASRAPYVLISNPDVVYHPGTIDALVDLLERRPRAAFAHARLLHADGHLQTSAGDLPGFADALLGRALSWRVAGREQPRVWWHGWAHDEERSIGHGAEACYLVRREALRQIGLQDERFRLDWEGIDWSARAWKAGWQVWFCPAATAVHLGGTSLRQVPGRWVMSTHQGMYLYLSRRTPPALRPLLALVVAVRAAVKLAALGSGAERVYERAHRGAR